MEPMMIGKQQMPEKIDQDSSEGSILIGSGVEFKGELTVPNRVSINGTFDGHLKAKELYVGKSGKVSGEIGVEDADVFGAVTNALTVGNKLILRASGSISGTLTYSSIMIEEGGVVIGQINKLGADAEKTVVKLHKPGQT